MLKDGEARLRELDALPSLVEDYLADLPYLVRGAGIPTRDHEVVGVRSAPRTTLWASTC